MDLTCPKEMLCRNFPDKCDTCGANSDLIHHYPRYEERDMVEVVRCKDCKYYEIHKPNITLNCERQGKLIPMMPNDFCSYGERKNDESY